jgi:ABC-2 type transport system ATP-binding protein
MESLRELAAVRRKARSGGREQQACHAPGRQTEPVLEVRELCKTYKGCKSPAVDHISFSVSAGEVVGLLGPNGAGKSTCIGMITTKIPVSSGHVRAGALSVTAEPTRARATMGVAGQANTLDGSCTVFENLYLHCRYHHMRRSASRTRADELLEMFRLTDHALAKPATLSGGTARRLELARAMAHEPVLLLLDEPTNELDAPSRAFFWEQIEELCRVHGTAALLATHLLEEAEEHCDRIVILDGGKIAVQGHPSELRREFRGAHTIAFELERPLDDATVAAIEQCTDVVRCKTDGRGVTVLLQSSHVPLNELARMVEPFVVEAIVSRTASLREIFLDVIDTLVWQS